MNIRPATSDDIFLPRICGIIGQLGAIRTLGALSLTWERLNGHLWHAARAAVRESVDSTLPDALRLLDECAAAVADDDWLPIGSPPVRNQIRDGVIQLLNGLRAALLWKAQAADGSITDSAYVLSASSGSGHDPSVGTGHTLAAEDIGALAAAEADPGPLLSAVGWLLEEDAVAATRELPVLLIGRYGGRYSPGEGSIARLVLETLPDGPPILFPHPRNAAGAVGDDFQAALDVAHATVLSTHPEHPPIRWWLRHWDSEAALMAVLLDGESLGASFAVGALSLLGDLPGNPRCAITACVREDGGLAPVEDIQDKVNAAADAGIACVVLSPDQAVDGLAVPAGVDCHVMGTVWEAANALDRLAVDRGDQSPSAGRLRVETLARVGEQVHLLWHGRRHYVPNTSILADLAFANPRLVGGELALSRRELEAYAPGPPVMQEGFLCKGSGKDVYLIQDERKRRLDREAFEERGYSGRSVVVVPDNCLDLIPTGRTIRSGSASVSLRLSALVNGVRTDVCLPGDIVSLELSVEGDGYSGYVYVRRVAQDGATEYVYNDTRDAQGRPKMSAAPRPLWIQSNGLWAVKSVGDGLWTIHSFGVGPSSAETFTWEAWIEDVNAPVDASAYDAAPNPIRGRVGRATCKILAGGEPTHARAPVERSLRQDGPRTHLAEAPHDGVALSATTAYRRYRYSSGRLAPDAEEAEFLPDGLLLRGQRSAIFLYQDGRKRGFRDGASFRARGYTYAGPPTQFMYVDLPAYVVDVIPDGPAVETQTADVRLALTFAARDTVANDGTQIPALRPGDRVTATLSVVGDGYTAYVHLRVTPPGGEPRYAVAAADGIVLRTDKRSLDIYPSGRWRRHNVTDAEWELATWQISEDDPTGEWTWEAWLEDVNVLPGQEDAVECDPLPISGAVARATYEVVARS